MSIKLSAVVITKNEAERLATCVQSMSFADEVIVVDSGSEDDTVTLAKSLGCRVIHQKWLGYGPQKQFAVEQASHDWVLCLDADEHLSPELADEIQQLLESEPPRQAYRMPRCNRFMGRWLRHGEGYPDKSLRLFNRQHARWSSDSVHERVVTDRSIGEMTGDLLHNSADSLSKYIQKQNAYSNLQAELMYESGRSVGVSALVISPFWRFVKMYFFRSGWMDGVPGLVHISIGCFSSFIKYAKLVEISRCGVQVKGD